MVTLFQQVYISSSEDFFEVQSYIWFLVDRYYMLSQKQLILSVPGI
jgi:hypothetical protein